MFRYITTSLIIVLSLIAIICSTIERNIDYLNIKDIKDSLINCKKSCLIYRKQIDSMKTILDSSANSSLTHALITNGTKMSD